MRTVQVVLMVGGVSGLVSQEAGDWLVRKHFDMFAEAFNKVYETLEERESRFSVFVNNLEELVDKNAALRAKGLDEIHGITKFADWTAAEFADMVRGHVLGKKDGPPNATGVATPTVDEAPSSFDWREKNVVTPVKDQGRCGSCYAHSAVETMESRMAIAGLPLKSLSVQQIVSCDTDGDDQGCDGGMYNSAWAEYVEKNGGLASEEDYPYDESTYLGKRSACDDSKAKLVVPGSNVESWAWATEPCERILCTKMDEDTLKRNLVSFGPVSIAVDASQWSSYSSGVLTSDSCASKLATKLDHAVQLVGYNQDADVPYWIVRNSWTEDWGNDGYIYVKMGDNTCGIADQAALVTLVDPIQPPGLSPAMDVA